jgi:hypothetical protein
MTLTAATDIALEHRPANTAHAFVLDDGDQITELVLIPTRVTQSSTAVIHRQRADPRRRTPLRAVKI